MDGAFSTTLPKRPFDFSFNRPETTATATATATATKKLNSNHPFPSFKPSTPPFKLSPGETYFKILCPAIKTGGIIGKGGSIIKQFTKETGAKIRIEETVPNCDERVILIIGSVSDKARAKMWLNFENGDDDDDGNGSAYGSPVQQALVRVFERILKVDEKMLSETEKKGPVVCRILAHNDQVGFVIGKGGKVVKRIRNESGAQVRVLPREQVPACAAASDDLIQIIGTVTSVKKAILSVSSCLQDIPRFDTANIAAAISQEAVPRVTGPPAQVDTLSQRGVTGIPAQIDTLPQRGFAPGTSGWDYHSKGYSSLTGSDNIAAGCSKIQEEEVVFRLLCSENKVGSVIGKGGIIVRTLQSETGALIKVKDAVFDSDERVIVISARENSELRHSPAQDAVVRVHGRIAEPGLEKSTVVSARLLVPSRHVGCLLGKGGSIIAEMRKATGTGIQIFANDQAPKCASKNDEVVQVTGSLQSVHDALVHITDRLRDIIFPTKPLPSAGPGTHASAANGMRPSSFAPPPFRARIEPSSTGRYPSVGLSRDPGHSYGQPALAHCMDRLGLTSVDQPPYHYSSERLGNGPITSDHPSPRLWAPQTVTGGNLDAPNIRRDITDIQKSMVPRSGDFGSGSQAGGVTNTTVEVAVPQRLMESIYGENNSSMNQIKQISGAKVVVTHDSRPGATEGLVIISGTPDQTRAAQSLLQAFILSG